MDKKETRNSKVARKQNHETMKMNTPENPKKKKDRKLPWWVELLFVQIGLPDNLLIKILRTKKKTNEIIKNDKKFLITTFFVFAILVYIYPIIKHARGKLNCAEIAKSYIVKNKKIKQINKKELEMLSTNFCEGGEEIYEIENLIN